VTDPIAAMALFLAGHVLGWCRVISDERGIDLP
jgi:hypothetical protein